MIRVKEIRGFCPLYLGDTITMKKFYVKSSVSKDVCMHALIAMSTLLSPILHGSSAQELEIGPAADLAYLQCQTQGLHAQRAERCCSSLGAKWYLTIRHHQQVSTTTRFLRRFRRGYHLMASQKRREADLCYADKSS